MRFNAFYGLCLLFWILGLSHCSSMMTSQAGDHEDPSTEDVSAPGDAGNDSEHVTDAGMADAAFDSGQVTDTGEGDTAEVGPANTERWVYRKASECDFLNTSARLYFLEVQAETENVTGAFSHQFFNNTQVAGTFSPVNGSFNYTFTYPACDIESIQVVGQLAYNGSQAFLNGSLALLNGSYQEVITRVNLVTPYLHRIQLNLNGTDFEGTGVGQGIDLTYAFNGTAGPDTRTIHETWTAFGYTLTRTLMFNESQFVSDYQEQGHKDYINTSLHPDETWAYSFNTNGSGFGQKIFYDPVATRTDTITFFNDGSQTGVMSVQMPPTETSPNINGSFFYNSKGVGYLSYTQQYADLSAEKGRFDYDPASDLHTQHTFDYYSTVNIKTYSLEILYYKDETSGQITQYAPPSTCEFQLDSVGNVVLNTCHFEDFIRPDRYFDPF